MQRVSLMPSRQWVITDAQELCQRGPSPWGSTTQYPAVGCSRLSPVLLTTRMFSLLPLPCSTLQSLCSLHTCPDVWPTSAPAGLPCSWMVLVGTHPTSCLPRQGMLFLQLPPLSQLQSILLPALSVIYCCAPSTVPWCMGSAASFR